MDSHKYLDLIPDMTMVVKTRNSRNTQVWWFDQKSLTIKTKLNNKSFGIISNGGSNSMHV
jgi:hypothetical protein